MAKSMNQKVDEAFKGWKGKNPLSNRQIGYWTLKSWKNHSKKSLSDPMKRKQKEYARQMFQKFETAIKKDEEKKQESRDLTITRSEVSKLLKKQNLGLPKKVFRDNKFAITGVKPTKKDVEKLAEDIKKAFQTPTHNKGRVAVVVRDFKILFKQNTKVLNDLFGRMTRYLKDRFKGESKGSDPDFQRKIKEATESNSEIKTTSKLIATNWARASILPKAVSLAGFGANFSLGAMVSSKAAATATLPSWAPWLAGFAVTCLVTSFAFKVIFKKVNKAKGSGDSMAYDTLAADIYAGYSTPESINKEYSSKLDKILKSDKDPSKVRDEILALYKEFDDNIRPSIDKGIYLLGESEGSEAGAFLKRGGDKEPPAFLRLKFFKDQYEAEDMLVSEVQANCEEISKMACDLFSGKTKVSKKTLNALKKQSEFFTTKKASAKRIAHRYYRLRSIFR